MIQQWIHQQLQKLSPRQLVVIVTAFILMGILIFLSIDVLVLSYSSHDSSNVRVNKVQHAPTEMLALTFGPNVHFGIVIDCGSSGSRVFIYFWPPHSGNPSDLLNIQQLMDPSGKPVVKKITPGTLHVFIAHMHIMHSIKIKFFVAYLVN